MCKFVYQRCIFRWTCCAIQWTDWEIFVNFRDFIVITALYYTVKLPCFYCVSWVLKFSLLRIFYTFERIYKVHKIIFFRMVVKNLYLLLNKIVLCNSVILFTSIWHFQRDRVTYHNSVPECQFSSTNNTVIVGG